MNVNKELAKHGYRLGPLLGRKTACTIKPVLGFGVTTHFTASIKRDGYYTTQIIFLFFVIQTTSWYGLEYK